MGTSGGMGRQGARRGWAIASLAVGWLLQCAAPVWAQSPPKQGGAIFTCTTAGGRKLTSDRPLAECLDREHRVLNNDGSLRTIMPPSLTSDERAALEDSERLKQQERVARLDAVRRDRNLLARYPNAPAHERARQAALDTVRASILASQQRVGELEKERKPLVAETDFYQGKALPPKLREQIEAVDASIDAQRELLLTQSAEVGRISALFDAELGRLQKLWAGAEPGSLGPLPQSAVASSSANRPVPLR